jgi:CPA2 family monovalent cation:H+ antiporter-2
MTEVPAQAFLNFFLYLLIPFIGGFIAKKLRIQSLVGYILAGVIIGNLFSGLISKEAINTFANVGIILLLFMVGLEINFEKLIFFKKFIILGGIIQVLASIFLITLVSPLFGFNLIQSFLIGIALSSSSTILVAKIIQERGEEGSFIGEMATGILIFQDIAFIPFIIIFNSLNASNLSTFVVIKDIFLSTLQSVAILSLMYYFGRKIVPHIFDRVARTSRELLNIFIVLFISLVCYLSILVGVPILLSAFIAGILVSQTTEHYHVFSQLRPMRDIMAIIFFVFIGTHINILSALPLAPAILSFSILVLFIKFLIVIGIFFYFKFNSRITFFIAILLFQIDEDSFILFSIAYKNNLFAFDQYIMLISTTMISLLVTPLFIINKEKIYFGTRAFFKKFMPAVELFIRHRLDSDPTSIDVLHIKHHVIICGYGRVGSHIGRALMNADIPFVAIDYNFHSVQKARKEGINIIYGDSTDRDILDYAEIESAVALISVVPDKFSQEAIILNAKKMNPKLTIISRVHTHVHQQRMKDLGADLVVEPELEASLSIIKRIFHIKGLSPDDRIKHLRHFRLEQGMA